MISDTRGVILWLLTLIFFLYGCGPGKDISLDVVLYEETGKGYSKSGRKEGHSGFHEVVAGDTIYGLSRRYELPVRLLIMSNKISAPYKIRVGDKLRIPPKPVYVVKSGDTIYNIARRFNISTRDVVVFNDMVSPYIIRVGDKLSLPVFAIDGSDGASGEVLLNANARKSDIASKRSTTNKVSSGARGLVNAQALSGEGFVWPVRGTVVRKFGLQEKGIFNSGLNVQVPRGTPVIASENGVVVYSSRGIESLGNLVLLKHSEGYVSAYGHLESINVSRGDRLNKGDIVGLVGTSGNVDKPQLHFQLRHKKKAIDPISVLKT